MARVRPARHYQHPQAPIRRLADEAIPPVARALKAGLTVARRLFDPAKAEYLLRQGRYREVAGLIDWGHADEAMRRPLALLGDVWLAAGEIGEKRLNGAFTSRRRVVRFKKTAAEAGRSETPSDGRYRPDFGVGAALSLEHESFLAKVAVEKDQADLFNYDRFDPVSMARIRAFQDELIRQLSVDSRVVIEETILSALMAGRGPDEIVAQIRAVIGLTDRQAAAVLRFRQQLVDMHAGAVSRALVGAGDKLAIREALAGGRALSAAEIDAMVARYENNYLDYRATMIATTEATRAASLGLQDSYTQAVERGVLPNEAVRQYWRISLDEKTCDHCLSVVDMNPDGVPLGEQFDSDDGPIDGPPYHPNCRCSLEFVTNLDLVPDDYDGG